MLNTGIIGTGFGAGVQFPGFNHHSNFDPIAISGKHDSKTKKIAEKLNIKNYSTNWKDIINNPEIDVVSIATPPNLHKEMVIAALQAGKHVLCEKPLAMNTQEAQEMCDLADESGLIAMLDLEFRYLPSRSYMVELIKNGYLGEIFQLDVIVRNPTMLNPRNKGYSWWSDIKKGGGVLFALGPHYFDFLNLIFSDIDSVSGKTETHIKKRLNKMTGRMKKVTADDAFYCRIKAGNTSLISLQISTVAAYGQGTRIEAYGNEGSLLMLEDQTLLGGKIGEDEVLRPLPIPGNYQLDFLPDEHRLVSPFIKLLDEFAKSVKAGRSYHPNFEDGLKIQKIIDGVKQSELNQKWVDIV